MITLPSSPAAMDVRPYLIDFGFEQRPATGAPGKRIDRPGMRMGAEFTYPPMPADTGRVFVNRLLRARSEGLRVRYPLIGVDQSGVGSPLVGSGATGTSLPVTNGAGGAQVREGYWLTLIDGSGVRYLHAVASDITLSGVGAGTLPVWPPLRASFTSGNLIEFAAPVIEGMVTSGPDWTLPPGATLPSLTFTIEEQA